MPSENMTQLLTAWIREESPNLEVRQVPLSHFLSHSHNPKTFQVGTINPILSYQHTYTHTYKYFRLVLVLVSPDALAFGVSCVLHVTG